MSRYTDNVAKGLCGSCGKEPLLPGKSQGVKCNQISKDKAAAKRQIVTAAGLCLSGCGKPRVLGKTRCADCAKKQVDSQKTKRAERNAKGLCDCGRPLKLGCVSCQRCINKHSKISSAAYQARKAAGLCYFCDNPPVPGFKLCQYHRDKYADYRLQLKIEVFEAYGGPVCAGCGDTDLPTLEIDHIDGGGCQHRKEVTNGVGGYSFYLWLKRNNFPAGFRVLCPTCNKKAHIGTLAIDQKEKQ